MRRSAILALGALLLAPAAARADFTTWDNPQGGRVIAGPLSAGDATTRAALIDGLRRTHRYFGAPPRVTRVVVTPDGGTALAFFSDTGPGGPVRGVVLASTAPGAAPFGALLYDAAGHLPQTLPALMRKAASLRPAAPANAPPPVAPSGAPLGAPAGVPPKAAALPLTRQAFPDGSGSVGVPAGWKMASFRQGRFTELLPGQPVMLGVGLRFSPVVPGSSMAQAIQRYPAPPGIATIYAAYDPDPARAMVNLYAGAARAFHAPGGDFALLKVMAERRLRQVGSGTEWWLDMLYRGGKGRVLHLTGNVVITPPGNPGNWFVSEMLHVVAPQSRYAELAPTFRAIVGSIRLNQSVIHGEMQASQARFDAFERTMRQNDRANFARHEAAIQQQTNATHASARAFIRTIQGVNVIADPTTGRHYEAPDDVAGALVKADPRHFQLVPLRGYIKGVDY